MKRFPFSKYHALGNDYIVINPDKTPFLPSVENVRILCERNTGIGSDGILLGPVRASGGFGVRIFNPDGSEAEKSGNGVRIFARYLFDEKLADSTEFTVSTAGGDVPVSILENNIVRAGIGIPVFDSARIPVAGPAREVVREELSVGTQRLPVTCVSVGNPHCVAECDAPSPDLARELGPLIECHKLFPQKTNVQFMRVLSPSEIQIEIWERGAGYTLASGTSCCAATAVAQKLGLAGAQVTVRMPGGCVKVEKGENGTLYMSGPVEASYTGEISRDLLGRLAS